MPLCVAGTVLGTGDIAENKAFTGPLLGDLLSRGDPDHKQDLYINRISQVVIGANVQVKEGKGKSSDEEVLIYTGQ